MLIIFTMLYITSLELITGSLYILTTFIQFSLPLPPTSGTQKPNLLSYGDYLEMHRNTKSLSQVTGTNIVMYVSQLYFKYKQANKTIGK